ncbi:hypothetical protein DPMN_182188 [Dreissena polymorpha]|uniref:Uncharacterized protein n=1 Tax=Dreissena polymorpha TaxID=45954 RepID=A0A9D4I544_DREPO|nr:hypothetical protein DPMN_182188 [Dreissena polymorpha]
MTVLPPPLRQCNETTFHVRTINIPLGDSSEKSSRKSSADDSRPGLDVHAPAADRVIRIDVRQKDHVCGHEVGVEDEPTLRCLIREPDNHEEARRFLAALHTGHKVPSPTSAKRS